MSFDKPKRCWAAVEPVCPGERAAMSMLPSAVWCSLHNRRQPPPTMGNGGASKHSQFAVRVLLVVCHDAIHAPLRHDDNGLQ